MKYTATLFVVVLFLSGCAATVPQVQYDSLIEQSQATEDSLQAELDRCQNYAQHLELLYDKLEAEATIEIRSLNSANRQLKDETIRLNRQLAECTAKLMNPGDPYHSDVDWSNRPNPYTYTVQSGDCLWTISGKRITYGNPLMWPLIYEANRDKIKNPDLIYPYQILLVPKP